MHAGPRPSQKWPMEGVLRPEIVKGGGFEGAEALRTRARTSFCYSFDKNDQKIWANGEGSDPHIPPPSATPLILNMGVSGRYHFLLFSKGKKVRII